MAKANLKPIPVNSTLDSIHMEIDENELKLLLTVLDFVAGSPDKSPRKYADSIRISLQKSLSEVRYQYSPDSTNYSDLVDIRFSNPNIYFQEFKK